MANRRPAGFLFNCWLFLIAVARPRSQCFSTLTISLVHEKQKSILLAAIGRLSAGAGRELLLRSAASFGNSPRNQEEQR